MQSNSMNNLKKRYEEQEIRPSTQLWNRLEKKLDGQGHSTPVRPSFGFWKYAAAVLLLVSLGYAVFDSKSDEAAVPALVKTEAQTDPHSETVLPPALSTDLNTDKQVISEEKTASNASSQPLVKKEMSEKKKVLFNQKFADNHADSFKTAETAPLPDSVENFSEKPLPRPENSETPVQSEEKIAETSASSYIMADELLFSREISKKRKKSRKESSHLVDFDLDKVRTRKPASFKILGVEMIDTRAETKN